MNLLDLSAEDLLHILDMSINISKSPGSITLPTSIRLIGSFLYGVDHWDRLLPPSVAGLLGSGHVPLEIPDILRKSQNDLLFEFEMFSEAVDLIFAGFIDTESFGAGRDLISKLAERSPVPFISIRDDVYAHNSALAHLAMIKERLGTLSDTPIDIRWTYGSVLSPPNTMHSLLVICAKLGLDVRVTCPPEFSPVRRVLREARCHSENVALSISDEPSRNHNGVVIAFNWSPIGDRLSLEKIRDTAFKYRDWYIDDSFVVSHNLLSMEPPCESEVSIDPLVQMSEYNLSRGWFKYRLSSALATVQFILAMNRAGTLF